LIRNDYNYFLEDMSKNPKPITSMNLNTLFRQLLLKTGLRTHSNAKYARHEIPIFHGMRKRFSSVLVESNLKTELRWLLEGHNLKGNDASYVRTTEKSLLEEYSKGIDALTISEEHRLRKKVKTLEVEKSILDSIASRLQELERKASK